MLKNMLKCCCVTLIWSRKLASSIRNVQTFVTSLSVLTFAPLFTSTLKKNNRKRARETHWCKVVVNFSPCSDILYFSMNGHVSIALAVSNRRSDGSRCQSVKRQSFLLCGFVEVSDKSTLLPRSLLDVPASSLTSPLRFRPLRFPPLWYFPKKKKEDGLINHITPSFSFTFPHWSLSAFPFL